MSETTELALLPARENAVQVFSAPNGLDPFLAQIRAEIDAFVPDVSTKKGRDAIASMAYKVAKSKTALDGMGKELVAELKQIPALIDAERKRMRDTLDAWRDEVRKPVDEWEAEQAAIEAKRLAEIAARELQEQVGRDHELAIYLYADYLREKEAAAKQAIIDAELAAKAQKEREEQIAKEAAENARIAAEQAAAAEVERAKREKAEAEAAALRQQQESERAATKAKADAEAAAKAAQERAEREKQQAIEQERQRVAAEAAAQAAEALRREKDTANKKRVNNEILADLATAGLDEATAKLVITAMAKGLVRNVKINY